MGRWSILKNWKICFFFESVPTGWANKSSNGGSVMVYHGRIRKNNFPEKETKVIEPPKSSLDLIAALLFMSINSPVDLIDPTKSQAVQLPAPRKNGRRKNAPSKHEWNSENGWLQNF